MGELRPHQVQPAQDLLALLAGGHNALDISDTGTGKTYVATYIANDLGRSTLAVVPKISQTAWHKAAAHFGDSISVVGYEQLRTGRSGFGRWDNNPPPGFRNDSFFKCQCCQLVVDFENNFQPCYTHPAGIHCIEEKKKPWKYGKFQFDPGIKFLIFDEIHRCAAIKSRNADMLIAARRQGVTTLGLSATAACGPLQMRALGYLLGLHSLDNFYSWSRRYGCGKLEGVPGWHWLAGRDRQKDYMANLNREIIPSHGVRVRVEDIPDFPKRTVEVCEYDLEDGVSGKINDLYADMDSSISLWEARSAQDKSADHPLTKNLRERQFIELLKVPLAVELANDYVAKGFSVGVFVNFVQTMVELLRRLNCNCYISGAQSEFNRLNCIAAFQSNQSRLMILNSEAGGVAVSLHDLDGNHPRVGLVMPPSSARSFKQLVGRFHRENGKSPCLYKVLLAAGTVEGAKYKKLKNSIDNIDALNDSDFEI